jgi:hypothetical protein
MFHCVKLIELYKTLDIMPWMFINILKVIDENMKESIGMHIYNNFLKNCPKKAFYTYLLIDISKFNDLRQKFSRSSLIPIEPNLKDFLLFKTCIFYVGKGIFNRKHQHLVLAKKLFDGMLKMKYVQLKVSKIENLWKQNKGISLVQLDCDATSYEASTRESCIIKSLNFNMLTNKNQSTCYGDAKKWPLTKIENYGDMLLYQLFRNFLAKEPNVIYAHDVIVKQKTLKKPKVCEKCNEIITA